MRWAGKPILIVVAARRGKGRGSDAGHNVGGDDERAEGTHVCGDDE